CAAAAPAPARAEAEPVKIVHRTDRNSGRLMLEFQRPVAYAVERSGPYAFLRFSRSLSGDLDAAKAALERYVDELRLAGGGRVLLIRIAGQPRMTHTQRGNSIVITWVGSGRPEPATAEKPPETKSSPAEAPPKAAEQAPRAEPPPAAKPEHPPQEAKRPEAEPAKPTPEGSQPRGAAPDTLLPPAADPALNVTSDGAETRIALAWPEPIGAAVFRHGDTVWMVFPRRQAFDMTPHQRKLGPGVERLARIEHAQATILAAQIRAGVGVRVVRERNAWTVVFKREPVAAPENDASITVSRGDNEHVAVALAEAETPIRLADPEIGTLYVVPSRAATAVAGERRYVTFRLIPATQGAVVEALADGVTVAAEGAAIIIRRSGGLLLSGGPMPGTPSQSQ
ncbi:MAG: hypothetical protein ACREIP_16005, partial [Alphaproteobacteria bacterium]